MKPIKIQNKKLNLNKQTIQKLDTKKLANVYAGEAENTAKADAAIAVSLLAIEVGPACLLAAIALA